QVFDKEASSPKISIFDDNENQITENIYLVIITFWNSGGLHISPGLNGDVIDPVLVRIENSTRIIDYEILESTKFSNFSIEAAKVDSNINDMLMDWDFMEPGYGVKFKVIYAGNDDTKIYFLGKIRDVDNFSDESNTTNYFNLILSFIFGLTWSFTEGKIANMAIPIDHDSHENIIKKKMRYRIILKLSYFLAFLALVVSINAFILVENKPPF
ncbi:hypothetical protein IID62_04905, partial [candidate division KSB1 bacterium]|nr:hypothetical protein [candidate division KSB1 bacterium]